MTARVIAVDFGERRVPSGEYRCRIPGAEGDGRQIEWRMQAIDGPCHELRFSTATDVHDDEVTELLETLGIKVRRSKRAIELGELVGRKFIISALRCSVPYSWERSLRMFRLHHGIPRDRPSRKPKPSAVDPQHRAALRVLRGAPVGAPTGATTTTEYRNVKETRAATNATAG